MLWLIRGPSRLAKSGSLELSVYKQTPPVDSESGDSSLGRRHVSTPRRSPALALSVLPEKVLCT